MLAWHCWHQKLTFTIHIFYSNRVPSFVVARVVMVARSVPGYSSGYCLSVCPVRGCGMIAGTLQWATVFRPIDSCKPLVLSQDEVEEEKERDTKETIEEKNGDVNSGSNQSQSETDKEAADNRRRAKEEEANADSGDKKDIGTEKAKADSPEKTKQNIQP